MIQGNIALNIQRKEATMYLGIDLGTSSVKVLLMSASQNVVASSSMPIAVSRPQRGWSEQDPADWISATSDALDALHASHPKELAAVRGIGLAGHMHGATLVDKSGDVLRPCILWNDTRSSVEAAALDADPMFRRLTGNIVFPGFTAPKLDWVRKNEPDIFKKVAKVLLPKDYLRLWLTGEFCSDMSDASGTSWLDVGNRKWSAELLEKTELSLDHMPNLVEGNQASGTLKTHLCETWGMNNVIVAGGAGDNAAAAIGLSSIDQGTSFVSLGTSGVFFAPNDEFRPRPESAVHAFCHAVPDKWHQMGVFLSATDSLNWWAKICKETPQNLTKELGGTLKPASDLTFLPYLSGERTPHNDTEIRGAFIGLDHSHNRADMTQAVLEGVAFALRDNLQALIETGTSIDHVLAVGGGTGSTYWLNAISTALQRPVLLPEGSDLGAAFGAARLGLMAADEQRPQDVCSPPRIANTFEPDTKQAAGFDAAFDRYRALYPAIAHQMTTA